VRDMSLLLRQGRVKSRSSVCYEIFRELEREAAYNIAETLCVLVHPEIAQLLLEEENNTLKNLEVKLARKIIVETGNDFHRESFEIIPVR